MKLEVQVYRLPKAGNTEEEYEDASAFRHQKSDRAGSDGCSQDDQLPSEGDHSEHCEVQLRTEDTFRAAIADGATESTWAKSWAEHLVEAYVQGRFSSPGEVYDRQIHQTWYQQQRKHINQKPASDQWYLEEGLRWGAHATFLGVEFSHQDGQWCCQASAVGDCCLFHIRNGALIRAFPLDNPDAFNSTPVLISTRQSTCPDRGDHDDNPSPDCSTGKIICQQGDEFWLMTDALACWLLRMQKSKPGIVSQIQKISSCDEFRKKIQEEREQKSLRNDDVTWMIIRIKDLDRPQDEPSGAAQTYLDFGGETEGSAEEPEESTPAIPANSESGVYSEPPALSSLPAEESEKSASPQPEPSE
ncbi:MAG: hypothetical protein KatS3mg107_1237 [Gemmataceae bacterium]|jgi:hypothetical protein|nr:MAG: hypothetical protein KatS3mg107_1237 [Gemmataceae bacterium]